MKAFKKIMDVIAFLEGFVISAITMVITAITFVNVLVRKFTTSSFAWSEEIVVNLFILLIMLGCALCLREGSMISLSLVFDRLGRTGKKILVAITTVVNCVFFSILLKTGWAKVLSQMASGKTTASLGIQEWMYTIFLPIGAIFLLLHTVEFFIDVMTNNAACVKEEDAQ
ncbi:MAG: TRAP transporter small permease [Oscillibacter sp.]|nr:TRAP transporter small permease [Oscillibacter sp.]